MEKTEAPTYGAAQRKILTMAVSGILLDAGFSSVNKDCLETLTEMIQCFIVETGTQSRNYCELAGRTKPVIADIVVALANMGIRVDEIEKFVNATRESKYVIPPPQQVSQQKQLNLLQAGVKNSHPPHIPNYLPVLPDPHAYIRTPTYKQPITEYELIRERAANQNRDIQKALTKFLAKTSETHSLFDTDDTMFPLIACKPSFPPYFKALNPTDQVFDFEELEYHYLVANRTEDVTSKENENESGNEDENEEPKQEKQEKEINRAETETGPVKQSALQTAILNNPNIDNPYLRAATLPKRVKSEPLGMFGL